METQWVAVRNCSWLHEARFLKSVLDGAGIEAMIPNQHTLGIQPLYGNLLGGARLLVRPDDLERAAELLDSAATLTGDPKESDGGGRAV